ncbi:MAG TPA: fibronectin type III-like domain-contianing protein [Polyangiaceae bacterium]
MRFQAVDAAQVNLTASHHGKHEGKAARTSFAYSGLDVSGGETVTATFTVTNTGRREGADVPQIYLTQAAGEKRTRLLGFERVVLKPGEARSVRIKADPRLLARFDATAQQWRITAGVHQIGLGASATDLKEKATATLEERLFGK